MTMSYQLVLETSLIILFGAMEKKLQVIYRKIENMVTLILQDAIGVKMLVEPRTLIELAR